MWFGYILQLPHYIICFKTSSNSPPPYLILPTTIQVNKSSHGEIQKFSHGHPIFDRLKTRVQVLWYSVKEWYVLGISKKKKRKLEELKKTEVEKDGEKLREENKKVIRLNKT